LWPPPPQPQLGLGFFFVTLFWWFFQQCFLFFWGVFPPKHPPQGGFGVCPFIKHPPPPPPSDFQKIPPSGSISLIFSLPWGYVRPIPFPPRALGDKMCALYSFFDVGIRKFCQFFFCGVFLVLLFRVSFMGACNPIF